LKALRVGEDFFINAEGVEVVQRFGTRPATRELKRAREAGTLHNTTRGSTARAHHAQKRLGRDLYLCARNARVASADRSSNAAQRALRGCPS
jgi:hypothetical protein